MEVTVRGAGIFGLSIAWACLCRGARVTVIDPGGPGAGASGGIVGALAPHVPEAWNDKKAFQLDALLMAGAFWDAVADAGGGNPGYARTGRLQPLDTAAAVATAETRAAGAAELWRGRASWRVVPALDHAIWAPLSASGQLVHDTLSARIHPRQACAALGAALGALGVQMVPEGPDRGQVVHATGAAGLQELSEALGEPVGVPIKGQAALLRHDAARLPQLFCGGVHVIPHADGTVAIGSTTERDFDSPTATDAALDDVIARARAAVPMLERAPVIARWAGLRPRSRSRAPILDAWPGRPGHWIANGGFKIGFGMAPKVAEVMADLLLEGRDGVPEGFRLGASLSKPRAGR